MVTLDLGTTIKVSQWDSVIRHSSTLEYPIERPILQLFVIAIVYTGFKAHGGAIIQIMHTLADKYMKQSHT